MIVVGGAAEALDAHPGSFVLTLQGRQGFVRVALTHGSSLVPVISFGETDVWRQMDNPPGSRLRNIQMCLMKRLGFSIPLIKGRGIFNYDFGLLPHRRPITSIVGEPIPLPKIERPTQEDINKYHQKYIGALQDLFDRYKGEYAPNSSLVVN